MTKYLLIACTCTLIVTASEQTPPTNQLSHESRTMEKKAIHEFVMQDYEQLIQAVKQLDQKQENLLNELTAGLIKLDTAAKALAEARCACNDTGKKSPRKKHS